MFNRRCSLLLCLLVLDGNATLLIAQTPAVQLQVYDYSGLSPESLHQAIGLTQQLLTEAGVSVEADLCQEETRAFCGSGSGNTRRLVIRVIQGVPKTNDSTLRPSLARSIADRQGGAYSSIFLERVQDAAAEADIPWMTVLGYATAHEVGHLLLGADAHTPQGVMKASWGREDYVAMNQHGLHFSKQQRNRLASQYGGRRSRPQIDTAQQ